MWDQGGRRAGATGLRERMGRRCSAPVPSADAAAVERRQTFACRQIRESARRGQRICGGSIRESANRRKPLIRGDSRMKQNGNVQSELNHKQELKAIVGGENQ